MGVTEQNGRTQIAAIHAMHASIEPTEAAFASCWPEARVFHLLDDSLSKDLVAEGYVTPAIHDRFSVLARYAADVTIGGARTTGILFTCSAFGEAIASVRRAQEIPVLPPNEAAFSEAIARGRPIALLVTFSPSRDVLEKEMRNLSKAIKRECDVRSVIVDGALGALQLGDRITHDQLIARAIDDCSASETVVLGQFSMSGARDLVAGERRAHVLTTPECAVVALRSSVEKPRTQVTK